MEKSGLVNMDCRARWIDRCLARARKPQDFEDTIKKASRLLEKYPSWPDRLWHARLHISRAFAYKSLERSEVNEQTNWLFDEIDTDIRQGLAALDDVQTTSFNLWPTQYFRAMAHAWKGLTASSLGNLEQAIQAHDKAIESFQVIKYTVGEARALNNKAYDLGRQGKMHEAMTCCEHALNMRKRSR